MTSDDLESALRAKLEEMWNKLLPEDYGHETIEEIESWLDSRPDGWTDLRENPGDLPEHHKLVCMTDGLVVVLGWCYEKIWKKDDSIKKISKPIIAWREIDDTISARFKSKEKV